VETTEEEDLIFGRKDEQDYYALLGISQLGLNASDKQIKKGYQEMVLKTHPDKIRPDAPKAEKEAANALFRDVQKAYDVLSNVEKRRGYDSQFEFDDTIPSGLETLRTPSAFFDVYGPVFEANARFSTVKPVPLLGTDDDEEAKVKTMYNFWRTFRSWRDFSAFDEFKDGDLETAEGRDHRRYMIKKNEAQREKQRKKEFQRIQLLVERAYKNDPRIARFKQGAEKQKEDAKNAKEAAKKAIEDAKRAEEEEKERKRLEAQKNEKDQRDAERKAKEAAKKTRKKAVKALTAAFTQLNMDELEQYKNLELLTGITPEEMNALAEAITAKNSLEPFAAKCQELQSGKSVTVKAEEEDRKRVVEHHTQVAKEEAEEKLKKTLVWPPEAISYLAKGMAKYPGGTRNRWQCIASFVETTGFQVSPDDCIEASKKLAAGAGKPSSVVTGAASIPVNGNTAPIVAPSEKSDENNEDSFDKREWTPEEQRLLELALHEFPATMELNERWKAVAAKVGTRTKKDCAQRVKDLKTKAISQM